MPKLVRSSEWTNSNTNPGLDGELQSTNQHSARMPFPATLNNHAVAHFMNELEGQAGPSGWGFAKQQALRRSRWL